MLFSKNLLDNIQISEIGGKPAVLTGWFRMPVGGDWITDGTHNKSLYSLYGDYQRILPGCTLGVHGNQIVVFPEEVTCE